MTRRELPVGLLNTQFFRSPHPTPDLDPLPALIGAIDGAQHTLRFATYSFTHLDIARAVIRAHARGVDVQGVGDANEWTGTNSRYQMLVDAGVPMRRWGGPFRLMHEKSAIVDHASLRPAGTPGAAIVTIGSYNWTTQAQKQNVEVMFLCTGVQVARTVAPAMLAGWQAAWDSGAAP